MSRRRPLGRLLPVLVLLAGVLAAGAPQRASADEAPSPKRAEQPNPSAPPARSPDQVLASDRLIAQALSGFHEENVRRLDDIGRQ